MRLLGFTVAAAVAGVSCGAPPSGSPGPRTLWLDVPRDGFVDLVPDKPAPF